MKNDVEYFDSDEDFEYYVKPISHSGITFLLIFLLISTLLALTIPNSVDERLNIRDECMILNLTPKG